MRRYALLRLVFVAIAAIAAAASAAQASLRADALRCEYRKDPLGIDTPRPRLSWQLSSPDRGQRQTAYRIMVGSSLAALQRGRADLWDTGRVTSGESIQIAYAGRPLQSDQACYWRVQVWDGVGKSSGWSAPAFWSMGLLKRSDWKARWIGCDIPHDRVPNPTYLPSTYMRKAFRTDKAVRRATVHATAAGLYELWLDGQRVGRDLLTPGWTEYAKRLYYQTYDVTGALRSRQDHVLAAVLGDGWYGLHHGGRGRLGLLAQLRVEYADGSVELVATDGTWKTTYEGPIRNSDIYNGEEYDARREMAGWSATGFDDSTWQPVRVGFGSVAGSGFADVAGKLRAAITGDALTIVVGNEAFGDPAYGFVKALQVQYRQGGRARRRTVREGETLRIEPAGPLTIVSATYGADTASAGVSDAILQAHPGSPVREIATIPAVSLKEPKPGAYVYDLGQNFAGYARLKVQAPAGRRVTLRFAEMLNPDGTVYTTNLRGAKCTDTYTCKGGGTETWEPAFTFHGFRYVELTGLPSKPSLGAVTGIAISTDAPVAGDWASGVPLLDRLYRNIVWGQRSNYLEVPTDCPQRDERMGWSGDAQVFIGTGTYNADVAPFFTAWLNTFNDAQDPQGGYPNVAPRGGGVSPAWGDAGIICPWTMWRMYGDTRVITDHWDSMARWIDYLKTRSRDLVRPSEGFGDWLNLGADMPRDVIATAYFAHVTDLMAQMAAATGRTDDEARYRALYHDIRAAYNKAFVGEDGRIKGDTQTTYLMALGFDLLPQDKRAAAVARLMELFAQRNNHISTGFLGVNLLLPVLTNAGHPDLAWTLLTNRDYPSWLYSVTQGATTIWERWDGWTRDRGFQDPGMNSFNHYAYGSCGEWMFAGAAGIDTDGPAFKRIVVRPVPGGGVDHLRAHYDSVRGRIATEWWAGPGTFELAVTIPANTTATVCLPATDASVVTEGGAPVAGRPGVRFVGRQGDRAVLEVGSGTYRFRAASPAR